MTISWVREATLFNASGLPSDMCIPLAAGSNALHAQQHVHALAVHLDGKRLHMARGELVQEHVLDIEGSGELMLLLQEHRPVMGQACEVTTGTRCAPCACCSCTPASHGCLLCSGAFAWVADVQSCSCLQLCHCRCLCRLEVPA